MVSDSLVGIIGWPISHSISPHMQNRAFLELGLSNWCYVPMLVAKPRLKEAVFGLRALGFKGANVTVPHKEAVVPYLDSLSDNALAIGAVNTIVVDKNERLVGHNTDGQGFINDLFDHGVNFQDRNVLILGAGGSARAITYELLRHGCKDIIVSNRTRSRADELVKSFKFSFRNATIDAADFKKETLAKFSHKDLIINTTSIGLKSSEKEMPWFEDIHLSPATIVYDLIYTPSLTNFLRFAQNDGARTINGLGMLVHQGALAFTIWTGHKAPIKAMKETALKADFSRSDPKDL